MNILVLCKVVDNYGDIGFAYRLSSSLVRLGAGEGVRLSLAVSDLHAFARMAFPQIDGGLPDQRCDGIRVLDWNDDGACAGAFAEDLPDVVLECFQCGRPGWLEQLLFDGRLERLGRVVRVVNVEYLTAEDWAEDFHLLKSATRSPWVRKVNFMPGFTARTGGLVLDAPFMEKLLRRKKLPELLAPWLSAGEVADLRSESCFCVLVFSYRYDFSSIILALSALKRRGNRGGVRVFLASGAGYASFSAAYRQAGKPFPLTPLPFLPQPYWDALLLSVDFAFVRGEDSFSRLCLSGTPFVWQAYPQEGQFHLVKVAAFLERLRGCLSAEDFALVAACFMRYNHNPALPVGAEAEEALAALPVPELPEGELWGRLLAAASGLGQGFADFAGGLAANGDLAEHLLAYLNT